jgi:hypothetical protein
MFIYIIYIYILYIIYVYICICIYIIYILYIYYIKMKWFFVRFCLFVCLLVCLYLIQIPISEASSTELRTRLPLRLQEVVEYVLLFSRLYDVSTSSCAHWTLIVSSFSIRLCHSSLLPLVPFPPSLLESLPSSRVCMDPQYFTFPTFSVCFLASGCRILRMRWLPAPRSFPKPLYPWFRNACVWRHGREVCRITTRAFQPTQSRACLCR